MMPSYLTTFFSTFNKISNNFLVNPTPRIHSYLLSFPQRTFQLTYSHHTTRCIARSASGCLLFDLEEQVLLPCVFKTSASLLRMASVLWDPHFEHCPVLPPGGFASVPLSTVHALDLEGAPVASTGFGRSSQVCWVLCFAHYPAVSLSLLLLVMLDHHWPLLCSALVR